MTQCPSFGSVRFRAGTEALPCILLNSTRRLKGEVHVCSVTCGSSSSLRGSLSDFLLETRSFFLNLFVLFLLDLASDTVSSEVPRLFFIDTTLAKVFLGLEALSTDFELLSEQVGKDGVGSRGFFCGLLLSISSILHAFISLGLPSPAVKLKLKLKPSSEVVAQIKSDSPEAFTLGVVVLDLSIFFITEMIASFSFAVTVFQLKLMSSRWRIS
mmetsp:Transcript_17291/g.26082  ORF Transcript_17291/g.26082 Transcript_17291/m.26082 type:complete len:213 (-) Transcript_17291:1112-1750(-)